MSRPAFTRCAAGARTAGPRGPAVAALLVAMLLAGCAADRAPAALPKPVSGTSAGSGLGGGNAAPVARAPASALRREASAAAPAPALPAPLPGGRPDLDLARRVVARGDHGGRPFAVIDKPAARLSVFDAQGRLQGSAPVLLGLAAGDRSVPGIGEKPLSQIRPEERTTPAGRFVAEPGRNLGGEDIVWVDYDAAVSMHRVRPLNKAERRLQRLASATPADNRISFGCINVPVRFYETRVRPAFAQPGGVVYVLPDRQPLASTFPGLYGADHEAHAAR